MPGAHHHDVPRILTPAHLEGYLAELDRRGLTGNTRRRKVASLRSFFGHLEDAGHRAGDPARRLIPPREHLQPRYLTEREYKALLDAVRHEPCDAAIIELLLQTGMRLSELSRLKLTDVELPVKITKEPEHVGAVHILSKGRKTRTVTLNWKACKATKAYLAVRPADTDDPHLFLTKFKLGIGPRSIENVVSKYLQEAGIRGRLGGRPRALDPRKVQIAQALYHDKSNSIADICRILRISRATLYRYIKTGTGEPA